MDKFPIDNYRYELPMAWYNYQTKKYDYFSGAPATDEQAVKYLPDNPAARGLFILWRKDGKSIEQAMINVLSQCVGEPIPYPLSSK